MWHHSLPLMSSFNKTEAAVFSCRLYFLRAFPFISLIYLTCSRSVGTECVQEHIFNQCAFCREMKFRQKSKETRLMEFNNKVNNDFCVHKYTNYHAFYN